MKQKILKRLGSALLAGIMLFGTLAGPLAPQPFTAAAAEATTETEVFSVAFAGSYAKAGQPMTLEVQNAASDSLSYYWTVDGTYVGSDATYTPTEDDLMKWIRVDVTCGYDTVTAEMFFSKLPVVYINTENGAEIVSKEEYINAELIIQGNETYNSDTTTLYNGVTEIRGRGNSTWVQPKKPYRLKLDKKTDVFGMGKSKHWVLLANYMDESLQRNTLAYDLSGSMGMEQCSTVFVDVILNGDFVGNYQFCENIRIDDTRVDIFDWESFCEDSAAVIAEATGMDEDTAGDLESYMAENMGWITSGSFKFNSVTYTIADYPDIEIPSINGGYLIELDEYYDEISKFKTASGQPIMFNNPEYLNTNEDMMNFVQTYIQAFEDAVESDTYTSEYEGNAVHYSDLYDFNALVDYWLISEIFFNEEINKKSTYMYKDIDAKMMMGPIWDMDWSSGGEGETYHTEQWATRYYSTNAQAYQWYKYLIQDPWFFVKAQERYWEIRDVQVAAMLQELDDNYELLKESAAANGERWGYGSSYETYVNSLRNWFNSHLSWMDEQMATQESLHNSLGYDASSQLTLTMVDSLSNPLSSDTAKTAPADAVATAGEDLMILIEGTDKTNGYAAVYVNGIRRSLNEFSSNSSKTVDIPSDWLTAPAGDKNVIEVQLEADGTVIASQYVTVITKADNTTCLHENTQTVAAVAPTCTETGLTEGTECAACGEMIVAQEVVPALGHTEVTNPGTDPTFDETGMTGGTVCEVCGEILSEPEKIPMLDYNEGIIPLEVLTVSCGDYEMNAGSSEGPAELVMDDDFDTIWHTNWKGTSREDHWIQFELSEDYIVDGLRYKPRANAANGTITQYEVQVSDDGVNFRTVDSGSWDRNVNWKISEFEGEQVKFVRLVAVDTYGDNTYVFASAAEIRLTGVKAADHEHSYEAVVTAPTCTEGGYTTYTCACGDTYTADETPATGHTAGAAVTENVVDATCTEAGSYDSVVYCSVCDTEISRNAVTVPALGHDWQDGSCANCGEAKPVVNPFVDVKEGAYYYDAVLWAVENNIAAGMDATHFRPDMACTRAQVITFLWRAAGRPEPQTTKNPFTDVKTSAYYYKAVLWGVENSIVAGTSATKFSPDSECTRAQVVAFLWRANGRPDSDAKVSFTDVKSGTYYTTAVAWAVENNITSGIGNNRFGVENVCTRGQIVSFLYRTYGKN